jgi:transcriptional regulator with XRE-family HTH domain
VFSEQITAEYRMASKLGKLIREGRKVKGFGLRELARRIGKSPAYLVSLERDDQLSGISDDTLQSLASELSIHPDTLHAAVQRAPENAAPRSPTQVALYRLIGSLPESRQKELKEQLEAEVEQKKTGGRKRNGQ